MGKVGSNGTTQSIESLGAVPITRKINGKPLSTDINIAKEDIGLGKVQNKALEMYESGGNLYITWK